MLITYHGYAMEVNEDMASISSPDGECVGVLPNHELPADEFSRTRTLKAWVEQYERTMTGFLNRLEAAGIEVEPVEPHRLRYLLPPVVFAFPSLTCYHLKGKSASANNVNLRPCHSRRFAPIRG